MESQKEKFVIQCKNINFAYHEKTSKPILNISDFFLKRGERCFLHGPSGSGKSTLLGILTGILIPSTGWVEILSSNIFNFTSSQRDQFRGEQFGYIFQSFNLIPYLSVLENIALSFAFQKKTFSKKIIQERMDEIMQHLGLMDYQHKTANELSIGQQQRVAAARALVHQPEILIADEPTSSLDFDMRMKFIELLLDQCNRTQTTVLFVSHDLALTEYFDKKISLKDINLI